MIDAPLVLLKVRIETILFPQVCLKFGGILSNVVPQAGQVTPVGGVEFLSKCGRESGDFFEVALTRAGEEWFPLARRTAL